LLSRDWQLRPLAHRKIPPPLATVLSRCTAPLLRVGAGSFLHAGRRRTAALPHTAHRELGVREWRAKDTAYPRLRILGVADETALGYATIVHLRWYVAIIVWGLGTVAGSAPEPAIAAASPNVEVAP